jgi:glycosyltransferase involved in cell wall biosynthesis
VYYRLEALSELDCRVDLLTYGQGEDVSIEGLQTIRIPPFRWLGPVRVGPSWQKLFLDAVLSLYIVKLLLRHDYEAVYAHEESVFICRVLQPLFGFKLIYDMHSSLPEQLVNFGFCRSPAVIALFERLERSSLQASDAVITISPALARHAVAIMGGEKSHALIENSLFGPVSLAEPASDSLPVSAAWINRLPAASKIVAYAGTLEQYQGIDLLLESLAFVEASGCKVVTLIIGGSEAQVEHYRQRSRHRNVEHCTHFTGALPHEVTRRLLTKADIFVSPRTQGNNTPLKVYEILASGKPLVATRIEAHTQILNDEVCFLSDPNPQAFALALQAAAVDEARSSSLAGAAKRLYDARYSPGRYREKMRHLLEMIETCVESPV